MGKELYRVESAVCATASGNLTDGKWQHDVSTALGLSGQRNPLGYAVVRFLSDTPSSVEVCKVVLVLAKQLMRANKIGEKEARDTAWTGFEWWRDSRCITCGGRGVIDTAQRTCPDCRGSGRRRMPERPDEVRTAIGMLIEAEQWMEGQLSVRLKDASYLPATDGFKVNHPRFAKLVYDEHDIKSSKAVINRFSKY